MGALNPQESGRKAPLACNAAFQCCNAVFVCCSAAFVKRTSTLQKSECCGATSAAQLLFSLVACCWGGVRGIGFRTR